MKERVVMWTGRTIVREIVDSVCVCVGGGRAIKVKVAALRIT